jgi:Asp-tRNA(Asn)/Glu-tRNA(Gln) amidotransferase A subunit family amidase
VSADDPSETLTATLTLADPAAGSAPDDVQRCLDIYGSAFDRREIFSVDYRLRRHDREYRWIRDDSCPRYSSEGEFIGEAVKAGLDISAVDLIAAHAHRRTFRKEMGAIAARYDAVVSPTAAGPAPKGLDSTGDPYYCAPWSSAGMPSISLPTGYRATVWRALALPPPHRKPPYLTRRTQNLSPLSL